jgi:hypothetical protein
MVPTVFTSLLSAPRMSNGVAHEPMKRLKRTLPFISNSAETDLAPNAAVRKAFAKATTFPGARRRMPQLFVQFVSF